MTHVCFLNSETRVIRKGMQFMNRIFKVIWSKTKHCYVVVSEYA
ncbi:ESPR domain-containing protein, partial [Mitsuokella sp.]